MQLSNEAVDAALITGDYENELRAEFGNELYEELRALALNIEKESGSIAHERRRRKVYILPGILGSKLSWRKGRKSDLVWVDLPDLYRGGIDKLDYRADHSGDIEPDGVIMATYFRMKYRLWFSGFAPEFLPYDWRDPVQTIATTLFDHIKKSGEQDIVLVCHSMGGLVAREIADLDDNGLISKVITLGTPNLGSYSPFQVLRGIGFMINVIDKFDREHTVDQLTHDVLRHWPGLLQMLPSPDERALNLFEQENWPGERGRPNKKPLQQAGELQASLPPPDERFTQIIGVGHETIQAVTKGPDGFLYERSNDGDETVPRNLAEMGEHVPRYYINAKHGQMPAYLDAIKAVEDLIKTGKTSRLPTTPPTIPLSRESLTGGDREETLHSEVLARIEAMGPDLRPGDLLSEFSVVPGRVTSSVPDLERHHSAISLRVESRSASTAAQLSAMSAEEEPDQICGYPIAQLKEAANVYADNRLNRDAAFYSERAGLIERTDTPRRIALRAKRIAASAKLLASFDPKFRIPASIEKVFEIDDLTEEEEGISIASEAILDAEAAFPSVITFKRDSIAVPCVGRIVKRHSERGFGTGFLIAPGVLLTNWHVLPTRSTADGAQIEFNYEVGINNRQMQAKRFEFETEKLYHSDKQLDFAIVAVKDLAEDGTTPLSQFLYLPLDGGEGKIKASHPVNIIQHPNGGSKSVVFRKSYLHALPASENTAEHFDGSPADNVMQYSGNTYYGSSGAPVLTDEWFVVGLHHAAVPVLDAQGRFRMKNKNFLTEGEIKARRLQDEVDWVANQAIRISRIVHHLGNRLEQDGFGDIGNSLVNSVLEIGKKAASEGPLFIPEGFNTSDVRTIRAAEETRVVEPALPSPESNTEKTITVASKGGNTVVLNFHFHSDSKTSDQVSVTTDDPRNVDVDQEARRASDYDDREGYNPDFLSEHVPLPRLQNTIAADAAQLRGSTEIELRYTNFSVVMSRSRRLAFFSAGNVNLLAPSTPPGDKTPWGFDPRLAPEFQINNKLYSNNEVDRGHLFRRDDAAWGPTKAVAVQADRDSYHWTNIAPQHEIYNRSNLESEWLLWGQLENHVTNMALDNTALVTVFNGPIFDHGADPVHRGVKIPRAYWKVVIHDDSDSVTAHAFVIGQETLVDGIEREHFDAGDFGVYQIKVRELEHRTKLDFGALRSFDPMETNIAVESMSATGDFIRINSSRDIL